MSTFMAVARGKMVGPFTFEQLEWMEGTGEISDASRVCPTGAGGDWVTWQRVKATFVRPTRAVIPIAFQDGGAAHQSESELKPLSRSVYIVLALFLGSLGVHNFYSGHFGQGIVQLILTVTGIAMLFDGVDVAIFLNVLVGLWIIGEIVAQRTDGLGRPMN